MTRTKSIFILNRLQTFRRNRNKALNVGQYNETKKTLLLPEMWKKLF